MSRNRLLTGLSKLEDTNTLVEQMQGELAAMQVLQAVLPPASGAGSRWRVAGGPQGWKPGGLHSQNPKP